MNESYIIDELRKYLKYRTWYAIVQIVAILSAGSVGWALRSFLIHR